MTELQYLNDTYLSQSESQVLQVIRQEQETVIKLTRTIFYPQGGGQPADWGKIKGAGGNLEVKQVRLEPDGTVNHIGKFNTGEFAAHEEVSLELDLDRRLLNTRSHSAGHLIDVAVHEVGMRGLKQDKGYHFPDGPYVEYIGEIEDLQKYVEPFKTQVQAIINDDVAVVAVSLSKEEAEQFLPNTQV